jgi:hypothetical protein
MRYADRHPSKYIQAADLKGKDASLTIARITREEVGEDQRTKSVIYFHGAKKGLILNAVNDRTVSDMYGDDDTLWIGKTITLFADKVMFRGKLVDGVRVRPNGAAVPAPAPEPVLPPIDEDLNDSIDF